mgnify:CR=1 FL=1
MQPLALLVTEKIEKAGKHLGLRVSWKTFEEKLLRGRNGVIYRIMERGI